MTCTLHHIKRQISYFNVFLKTLFIFISYRQNNDLVNTIKSNNVQDLVKCETKNLRNNLLMFKYNRCETVNINNEGNFY